MIFSFMEPGTVIRENESTRRAFQSEKLHLMGRSSEYRSL